MGRPSVSLVIYVAFALAMAGCASTNYISKRHAPLNPLAGPLQLLSRSGPKSTSRTTQLLRRYDLYEGDLDDTLSRLQEEIEREPLPEKLYAFAELAYVEGKRAELLDHRAQALELYSASVAYAYWYLFDPGFDHFRNPYDPQFRGACDLYNGSLEAVMRIVSSRGELLPGSTYRIHTGNQHFHVKIVPRGRWHAEDFQRLEFVSDYQVEGLANRHHTYGLGVPLIAVWQSHERDHPAEQCYPPGLSFAVTAFLRVMQPPTPLKGNGDTVRHCVLELYDTVAAKDISVCRRRVPLETDLTTPLAYFLDNPDFDQQQGISEWANSATRALLDPGKTESLQGIYMLEPYEPHKIPVLMVHGLWSNPVTWMEMFNDLRSFPEIRHQYQFWFYLYPTGQPFWISARQLREDLEEVRQILDPQHRSPTLDQMVLIGHSMGGLVSKMQTIDSGDAFWKILSDRPFEELNADEETRERLAQTVFFKPNPSIRRVITIGTPHRGSDVANDYTRWLGRKLITLPDWMVRATSQLTRQNPGFFRNTEMLTINTSIDSLSPDSPVFPVLLRSRTSPRTQYHNILGLIPNEGIMGSLAAGSDGVVSYESAHLDGIASEITVEANHLGVHRHPRSILEVRRILLEHRVAALAEMGKQVPATYASYQDQDPCRETMPDDAARLDALAVAKSYLEYPENAEYKAVRHEDGYRVFVEYLRYDENGQPVSFPGGHCLLTVSADGQVTDLVPGG